MSVLNIESSSPSNAHEVGAMRRVLSFFVRDQGGLTTIAPRIGIAPTTLGDFLNGKTPGRAVRERCFMFISDPNGSAPPQPLHMFPIFPERARRQLANLDEWQPQAGGPARLTRGPLRDEDGCALVVPPGSARRRRGQRARQVRARHNQEGSMNTSQKATTTAFITEDEWYPVFTAYLPGDDLYGDIIEFGHGHSLELSAAEVADLQRLMTEFDAWQAKLRDAYRKATP